LLTFVGVLPVALGNTHRLWKRLGRARRIAMAVSFNWTWREPPCLERGMVSTRLARLTCSQRRLNCSPWRSAPRHWAVKGD